MSAAVLAAALLFAAPAGAHQRYRPCASRSLLWLSATANVSCDHAGAVYSGY